MIDCLTERINSLILANPENIIVFLFGRNVFNDIDQGYHYCYHYTCVDWL
jgi:hypothetical protein